MMRPVFQRVTNDEFRLVMAQADSLEELARMTGVALSTISKTIKDIETGKRKKSCYQVTWITMDDE